MGKDEKVVFNIAVWSCQGGISSNQVIACWLYGNSWGVLVVASVLMCVGNIGCFGVF